MMSRRLIPFLAFVLYANLLVNVVFHLFHEPAGLTGISRTSLAAASELPGATKGTVFPEGTEHVLRVALLLPAAHGDTTAIGDVKDVPYASGDWLDVPLAVNRPLLPEFASPAIAGSVRLQVYGPSDDLAVLWFERENLMLNTGSGSPDAVAAVFYPERWIVRRGEPLVCLGGRHAAAVVFLVLSPEEAARTDGGTLAFWRQRFRGTATLPVIDRADATAALRTLRPIRDGTPLPEDTGVAATALLNGALGAYALGDLEGLNELRRAAAARLQFVRTALVTLRHERRDEEWTCTDAVFALQLLECLPFDPKPAERAVGAYVASGVHYFPGLRRLRELDPPFRTFRMLSDPQADFAAARRLSDLLPFKRGTREHRPFEYDLVGDVARFAFEHDPPNDRERVAGAWEEARDEYLDHLPRADREWLDDPEFELTLILIVAAIGIVVALVPPRGRGVWRLTRGAVGYCFALTAAQLLIPQFRVGWVLGAMSLTLFVLWLWSDIRHPWWERVAIAVSIASFGAYILVGKDNGVAHPLLRAFGGAWAGFAWLVAGRVVLTNPQDVESRAFAAFLTLYVFSFVQLTAATVSGSIVEAQPAVRTTLGVAGAALLWFCLEGPITRMVSRVTGRGG